MKIILLLAVLLATACQGPINGADLAAENFSLPPSLDEAGNIDYSGIDGSSLTLVNGGWEGDPWVEGGAARPRAGLAKKFSLHGDVDGDGSEETIVLLWTSSGGSGTFDYIAVVDREAGGNVVNTGTAPLGDRVKIRSAEVVDGRMVFDVVQAGPNDAMCCPGQKVRRTFVLQDSGLKEISSEDMGRENAGHRGCAGT